MGGTCFRRGAELARARDAAATGAGPEGRVASMMSGARVGEGGSRGGGVRSRAEHTRMAQVKKKTKCTIKSLFDTLVPRDRLAAQGVAAAVCGCLRDTARVPERALAPDAPDLADDDDVDWPSAEVDWTSSHVRDTFLLGGFIVVVNRCETRR